MKYIITESKLEEVIIKYLNKFYGGFKEYRTDKHPKTIFFVKNDKIYMEYDMDTDTIHFSKRLFNLVKDDDWDVLFDIRFDIIRIHKIMREWIEQIVGKEVDDVKLTEIYPLNIDMI